MKDSLAESRRDIDCRSASPRGRNLASALSLVVGIAILATQMTAAEAAPLRFGAKLTNNLFPSNAGQGQYCNEPNGPPHPACTWVEAEALGRPKGGARAPKTGTIGKLRLISCIAGSFVLQVARAKPGAEKAKVIVDGPLVKYKGDSNKCNGQTYDIEVIDVEIPVKKGDYLAVKTKKAGMLRCDSGGTRILQFEPPLVPGGPLETADDTDGCFMLLEAEYQ